MPGPAFFVSYAKADQSWAEWLAWRLEAAGWRTVLQAWDFRPGSDFVQQMHRAVQQAERTIAVLSPAYLESAYASAEWGAVFRNAGLYDLIWWVPAENELLVTTGLAALAPYLGLPTSQDQTEQAAAVMAELGRPERRARARGHRRPGRRPPSTGSAVRLPDP